MIIKKTNNKTRVNDYIRVSEVRLIDEKGGQVGIVDTSEAKQRAKEVNLDLVEVSPNAEPPVCKIMDFGKYVYELKQQKKEAKKKQKKTQVKTIKYRPGTEEGDYQIKFRNLVKFLDNGDKVKVSIWFRGREMQHKELGMEMLDRLEEDTKEFANVEQKAKLEGRQLGMMLAPKSKKK
ncbi:translation initiation factor IF-3 [Bathymodiolus heckerae thiotrophic gill symbiont]|uniref:translation initiation factor IF-3 n=1 Tax=Bathymodiolus heckerae thiotrophic gill symbiont TaxID=1052212 RepID=UPI0014858E30|nr:translation initiation factor IF-3 [Bathymodiolus heckerae thiotrophic gill symbiont]